MIEKIFPRIPHDLCIFDGDYGNKEYLRFLHESNLNYSVRIAKNRKVILNGDNKEIALVKHPFFQLKRNQLYKSFRGTYNGIPAIFTSHKRNGKNGTHQTVFVVSNLENLSPKEQIDTYSCRWPIEKMFRTLKQSLGIQDCQARSEQKQRAHIFATVLAFSEVETMKNFKKKKSPEQIIQKLRFQNRVKIKRRSLLLEGYIM